MDAKRGYVLATPKFTATLNAADAHDCPPANHHALACSCGGQGTAPKGDSASCKASTGSQAVKRHRPPKRARKWPTCAGVTPLWYRRKKSTLYRAARSAEERANKQPAAPIDRVLLLLLVASSFKLLSAAVEASPSSSASSSLLALAESAVSATPPAARAAAARPRLSIFSLRATMLRPYTKTGLVLNTAVTYKWADS